MIFPVILAGGKGERFWPYSNLKRPKQLLPLVTQKTMLEDTLNHIKKLKSSAPIHIIVSKNLEGPIQKLLGKNKKVVLIGEPLGKNTATAIALAAKLIHRIDPKGVMVVLTADHAISPSLKFVNAIKAAGEIAGKGDSLVTFGINPDRPETGYGYIEAKTKGPVVRGLSSYTVKRFREKPSLSAAKKFIKTGKILLEQRHVCMGVWTIYGS